MLDVILGGCYLIQCQLSLWGPTQVAERLEKAVTAALEGGYRTADLYSAGTQKVGCSEMGNVLQDMLRCRQPAAS